MGIIICGLNGSGKSTLGRVLADRLGWRFIDNEDLYFPETKSDNKFASSRTEAQFLARLEEAVSLDDRFVYAAVKADHAVEITSRFTAAVLVETPRELRLQRVIDRTLARSGRRALPGGDLYEQEQHFYAKISSRPEDYTTGWLNTMHFLVLRVDGTSDISVSAAAVITWLQEQGMHPTEKGTYS